MSTLNTFYLIQGYSQSHMRLQSVVNLIITCIIEFSNALEIFSTCQDLNHGPLTHNWLYWQTLWSTYFCYQVCWINTKSFCVRSFFRWLNGRTSTYLDLHVILLIIVILVMIGILLMIRCFQVWGHTFQNGLSEFYSKSC